MLMKKVCVFFFNVCVAVVVVVAAADDDDIDVEIGHVEIVRAWPILMGWGRNTSTQHKQ